MTIGQIPHISNARHHIPLKVEPTEALVNVTSQEIVEQLVELYPLYILQRLFRQHHLYYCDAQHPWIKLLMFDEQPC